jgi:hypothetical protein
VHIILTLQQNLKFIGFEDIKRAQSFALCSINNYYLFDLEVRLNANNEPAAKITDAIIVTKVVLDDPSPT